jgi:hypothetical protein
MTSADRLDRAAERFERGQDKRALDDLWYAEATYRADAVRLRRLLEITSAIRDRNTGRLRKDADLLGRTVEANLEALVRSSRKQYTAQGQGQGEPAKGGITLGGFLLILALIWLVGKACGA